MSSAIKDLAGSTPSRPIRVIQVGLGPIGQRMVRDVLSRRGLELSGAVDIDTAKQGRDIGDVCGLSRPLGLRVSPPSALRRIPGDVCIVTTVSSFVRLAPLLEDCLKAGKHVVSSCEELSFPYSINPEIADRIDRLARRKGLAVLGTGINPGFLMDMLPVLLSGLCRNIESVRVERHQDSRIRRLPFQQKIGAGLTAAEFEEKKRAGKIRHVGFEQSIRLIAQALGWKLDAVDESVEPVFATEDVSSSLLQVPPGRVAGVHQTAHGYINGRAVITLELDAYNGLREPHDTVFLKGTPDITSEIQGGVHGDISTSAIILNCVQSIVRAKPGLRTMVDIPVIHWLP